MKYSILGFNQEKIITYSKDDLRCDLTDLVLLNFILYAQSNPKMKHIMDEENQPCVWLQHEHILSELPILNITEGTLKNRLLKLRRMDLIASKTVANENTKGTRTYYRTTALLYDMIFDSTSLKNDVKDETTSLKNDVKDVPRHSKMTSDNSINNNTYNNSISNDIESDFSFGYTSKSNKENYTEIESFKDLYNEHCYNLPKVAKLTDKRIKAIKNIIKRYSRDDIIKVFDLANESDFLKGNNDRGWKADIDFILREDKFVNILEGKYGGKRKNVGASSDMGRVSKQLTQEERRQLKEDIKNGKFERI